MVRHKINIKFTFGKAIENKVIKFYNLFNPEDDILGPTKTFIPKIYTDNEFDSALGKKVNKWYWFTC